MTDFSQPDYNELDSGNTGASPNGVAGSYSPSQVAPIIRAIRGASKRAWVRQNPIYTTTGTGGAAYTLTYIQGPVGYVKGEIYSVWAHADCAPNPSININGLGAKTLLSARGEPLTAGAIKAGDPISFVFDGTSFRLISGATQDLKLTGTTTLTGNLTLNSNGTTLSVQRNNANAIDIEAFLTGTGTTKHSIDLNRYGGAVTINGQTAWHAGNDGIGSTLDADLLDGQQGSFYQNASNLNAGTIADARLPSTMSAKTISGVLSASAVTVNSAYGLRNTNGNYGTVWYQDNTSGYYLVTNSGDQNGSFNSLRPLSINLSTGAVGMGHGLTVSGGNIVASGRVYAGGTGGGFLETNGNVYMPWAGGWLSDVLGSKVTNDGGTYGINVTGNANGAARLLRSNGSATGTGMQFNWSGQSGQPQWLWGGNDGAQMYVYNPSNFSVNYANSAGTAGTASNSNALGGIGVGGFSQFSTSGNQSETNFPIGQVLGVATTGVNQGRRELRTIYLHSTDVRYYTLSSGAGAALAGSWRQIGQVSDSDRAIYQRVS